MKYYYPFVTYRQCASVTPAIFQILRKILNNEKIQVYSNKEQAEKKAKNLLFDDDDCGVLVINYCGGIVEFYTLRQEYYKERIILSDFNNLKKYFLINP